MPGVPGVTGQERPETCEEGVPMPTELCGEEVGLAPLEGTDDWGNISAMYSNMPCCSSTIFSWSTSKGATIKNHGSCSIFVSLLLCSESPLKIFS